MEHFMFSNYTQEELRGFINEAVKEAIKDIQPTTSPQKSETLLTRKETAEKLKISLVSLNDYTKRGLLQSYLIGGRVLYKDSEIEASLYKTQTVRY